MKSTDNNLYNHLKVTEIDIRNTIDAFPNSKIFRCDKDYYDAMQQHDPRTTYIVKFKDGVTRCFIGDMPIEKVSRRPKYVMSITDNCEYQIFINLADTKSYDSQSILIPLVRYDDPQKAINALHAYRKVGSSEKISLEIFIALGSYISKENGINELLINLIGNLGYRDDPRLQYLNELAVTYGVESSTRDLSPTYRTMLHNIANKKADTLVPLYSAFYDVIVKYDFFKGKKYSLARREVEELDLSEEVNDIYNAYMKWYIN